MERSKSEIYDDLFERTDRLMKKYNPCNVQNGQCRKGDPCCTAESHDDNLENNTCKYLKIPEGCSIKSLTCRLWLCGIESELAKDPKYKSFLSELQQLRIEADKYKFFVFRGTKEQSLKRSNN